MPTAVGIAHTYSYLFKVVFLSLFGLLYLTFPTHLEVTTNSFNSLHQLQQKINFNFHLLHVKLKKLLEF